MLRYYKDTSSSIDATLICLFFMCGCQADPVMVVNDNNVVVVHSNRLQEGCVPPLEQGMVVGQLVLADALIIGNSNNQVLMHSL